VPGGRLGIDRVILALKYERREHDIDFNDQGLV